MEKSTQTNYNTLYWRLYLFFPISLSIPFGMYAQWLVRRVACCILYTETVACISVHGFIGFILRYIDVHVILSFYLHFTIFWCGIFFLVSERNLIICIPFSAKIVHKNLETQTLMWRTNRMIFAYRMVYHECWGHQKKKHPTLSVYQWWMKEIH